MNSIAAGTHFPIPWLFEFAKRPDDTADYWLDCSFFPSSRSRVLRSAGIQGLCDLLNHSLGIHYIYLFFSINLV